MTLAFTAGLLIGLGIGGSAGIMLMALFKIHEPEEKGRIIIRGGIR